MKAVIVEKPGSIDVLQIQDVPEPVTTDGQVKIRTRAFGLNRAETYYRSGHMGEITEPRIPGIEVAGEVVEDRSGTFQIGQTVIGAMGGMMLSRHGSYAEYVVVPATNLLAVEAHLSWEELASLPQAYLTIWGALDRSMAIQRGQSLLVRGGTTTLGLAAITYAKARGLYVVATTRNSANMDLLITKGADEVILDNGSISDKVFSAVSDGVDCALDIIGVSTIKDTVKSVKPWGNVCVVGVLSGAPVLNDFNLLSDLPNAVRMSFFASGLLGSTTMPLKDSPIQWIIEQVENRKMPSIVSEVYEFDQIRQAHHVIESDRSLGKSVVRI